MKATFFSSVAHELRTPLNSIIPMLKLILDTIIPCFNNILEVEKLTKLLKIILNSSIHLQNVIEDALDLSRLENNNFTLNKQDFNLRRSINEVVDIMKF